MGLSRSGADFLIWWKTTRISECAGVILRETASQVRCFSSLNKRPNIFFYMRQEALHTRTCVFMEDVM
jgi:hypothetical protein